MELLKDILNELLTESVSVNDVNSAIDNHERIIINYHTKGEDKNTGARVIEVYAYGLTKAGNQVVRAFQPYGDTTTKTPNWKFFRLDRISTWKPTGQKFSRPADFFYKGLGDFNPNGDDTMSIVYKIANFDETNSNVSSLQNGPRQKGNDGKNNIYKTDTEHRMERLRNQLNNPIKLSDIKDKNGFKNINDKPQSKPTTGPKVKPKQDLFKTDTERGMDKLRQQLDNPRYIDSLRDKKTDDVEDLRQKLGDTSKPIPFKELQQRLSDKPDNNTEKNSNLFKTDTERGMDKLRQQLDNPRYIDLSKISKR